MTRYLNATVYEDGRQFLVGTSEEDIPEEFLSRIGDHAWTEEDPSAMAEATDSGSINAALHRSLAERDADNSELRKQLENVTAERDALQAQLEEAQASNQSAPEEDFSKLNKEELVALAQERGADIDPSFTKPQIIAAIQQVQQ